MLSDVRIRLPMTETPTPTFNYLMLMGVVVSFGVGLCSHFISIRCCCCFGSLLAYAPGRRSEERMNCCLNLSEFELNLNVIRVDSNELS